MNGGRELATASVKVVEADQVRSEFVRKKHRSVCVCVCVCVCV